jgi:hypothetical protein
MGYTIWPDGPTGEVLSDVNSERSRQEELKKSGKFFWTCASPDVNDSDKLAVLAEEFGEVSKEVVDAMIERGRYAKETLEQPPHRIAALKLALYKELVQVAAVAVAWAESLR